MEMPHSGQGDVHHQERTGDPAYVYAGEWTDRQGVVHIRNASTGCTYCGLTTSSRSTTHSVVGCDQCVAISIGAYARHDCGRGCWGAD